MQEKLSSYTLDEKFINIYFWMFVVLHVLIWTLGPFLVRPSLTHDTLEGITWGMQWQLGYNKHPFLTAWLCAGITRIFGSVGWPVYLLAQVAVATTFWAVWKLAQQLLPITHALIATLLLEGVLFYNLNSFNLTPDTLQSPFWALFALFSYQALSQQLSESFSLEPTDKLRKGVVDKNFNWFFVALFGALGVVTKYQAFLLIFSMFMFCLINPLARKSFKKAGIYWAIIMFLLLITPHIIWLIQHDFITLNYAMTSTVNNSTSSRLQDHAVYPLLFLISSGSNILGVFILCWPFYSAPSLQRSESVAIENFNRQFLYFLGFGPLLLSLIVGMISGDKLPSRWSTPYYFLIGILMMDYLKPFLIKRRFKQFLFSLIVFSFSVFVLRMGSFLIHPRERSDLFLPNQAIAQVITKLWSERYSSPLSFIAGSHYLVALTAPYIPGAPKPYLDWNNQECPWINEDELRKKGGVFIWDEGGNYIWDADSINYALLPEEVLRRFPSMIRLPSYLFHRLPKGNEAVLIGIAILPPNKERSHIHRVK